MFTGLVEEVGTVLRCTPPHLTIGADRVLEDLREGDSIAVNGACLTVIARREGAFTVALSPETMRRTNLGELCPGDPVNLERALPAHGRLGGHLVQGHVEGTGRIRAVEPDGEAMRMWIEAPPELMPMIVPKGYIAVDGVSLTVIHVIPDAFSVMLIPYTQARTALSRKRPGDRVNLETDIVGRYLWSWVAQGLIGRAHHGLRPC